MILSQSYEAISICNVRKAIILLVLKKAELVEVKNGFEISSPSRRFPFPSIIKLNCSTPYKYRQVILTRKNIFRRDGHKCQYCGRSDLALTIDHVIPKARGGSDGWENLVTACTRCNNKKGDRTPEEAEMKLLRKPFKPSHIMFLKHFVGQIDERWKPYLYMD